MIERPFDFEWEEISIRSVTIEARSKREALRKWKNGDYETPHFDSQDIIGEVVTIDGEDYELGEGGARWMKNRHQKRL